MQELLCEFMCEWDSYVTWSSWRDLDLSGDYFLPVPRRPDCASARRALACRRELVPAVRWLCASGHVDVARALVGI